MLVLAMDLGCRVVVVAGGSSVLIMIPGNSMFSGGETGFCLFVLFVVVVGFF